jgi:hypothetical protein
MNENSKKMIPIMTSTSSTGAKNQEQQTYASMSKQTYVTSGLTADERALANLPTQKLMQVIDFVEQSGMPISVALNHEEPPGDPSFVYLALSAMETSYLTRTGI